MEGFELIGLPLRFLVLLCFMLGLVHSAYGHFARFLWMFNTHVFKVRAHAMVAVETFIDADFTTESTEAHGARLTPIGPQKSNVECDPMSD